MKKKCFFCESFSAFAPNQTDLESLLIMTDKTFITTLLDLLHANLVNRPKKTFVKWRQSLQVDWLILPIITFKYSNEICYCQGQNQFRASYWAPVHPCV